MIWAVQQAGSFSVTSDNASSPWYDGAAQTAMATIPQSGDTITNAGAFTLTYDMDATGRPPDPDQYLIISGEVTPRRRYGPPV
jgi:hypothetical protein